MLPRSSTPPPTVRRPVPNTELAPSSKVPLTIVVDQAYPLLPLFVSVIVPFPCVSLLRRLPKGAVAGPLISPLRVMLLPSVSVRRVPDSNVIGLSNVAAPMPPWKVSATVLFEPGLTSIGAEPRALGVNWRAPPSRSTSDGGVVFVPGYVRATVPVPVICTTLAVPGTIWEEIVSLTTV